MTKCSSSSVTLSLLCMQQMLTLSWWSAIYSIFIVMIITDFIWLMIVQRFVWSTLSISSFSVMSAVSSYDHNILIDTKWFLQFLSNLLRENNTLGSHDGLWIPQFLFLNIHCSIFTNSLLKKQNYIINFIFFDTIKIHQFKVQFKVPP